MREIKFRAWDKDKCVMLDDVFYTKTPHGYGEYSVVLPFKSENYYKAWGTKGWKTDDAHNVYKYDLPLMQYTGLKDKNGVEIYEGDIVAIDMWQGNEHGYIAEDGVIKWYEQSSAFKWFSLEDDPSDGHNYWLSQADSKQREVIGNIYENPELLK